MLVLQVLAAVFVVTTDILLRTNGIRGEWYLHRLLTPLLSALAFIVPVIYRVRPGSMARFRQQFRLPSRPSDAAWSCAVIGLGMQFANIWMAQAEMRWSGYDTPLDWNDAPLDEPTKRLAFPLEALPSALLLAPVTEEILFRGFLFKAFRGSFDFQISAFLTVLLHLLAHWNHFDPATVISRLLFHSLTAFLLCRQMERSNNLWDCMILHFSLNLTGVLGPTLFHVG